MYPEDEENEPIEILERSTLFDDADKEEESEEDETSEESLEENQG